MSYFELYQRVQTMPNARIKSSWIRDRVIEFTDLVKIKEQWTRHIDPEILRGFYILGPQGAPIPLLENEGLIVIAKDMPEAEQRIVRVKELMHAFDQFDERTDNPDKFKAQIDGFFSPTANASPQFVAEHKAYWMALGVLCPAELRFQFRQKLSDGETTIDLIGSTLKIPVRVVHDLIRDDFEHILEHILS